MSKQLPNWYRVYVVCRNLAISFDHYLRTKATKQQSKGMTRLVHSVTQGVNYVTNENEKYLLIGFIIGAAVMTLAFYLILEYGG